MSIWNLFPKHKLSLQSIALPPLGPRLTKRAYAMQLTKERKEVLQGTKSSTAAANDVSTLKINGSRLMSSLHESCEFGKAHPYGT